jgi:hypothetical protein
MSNSGKELIIIFIEALSFIDNLMKILTFDIVPGNLGVKASM